ncbi:MAG: peptidase S41, partial [Phycisphaerales bacterium]
MVVTLLASSAAIAGVEVDLPRVPSISPDGSQVVCSWRGDLWRVPTAGGDAIRLTSHPAVEGASAWSPDGSLIAFESERDGFRNIHLMAPDGSGLRQLTFSDLSLSLTDFGLDPDGKPAVFVSAALEGDLYRSPRPYLVPIDGGAPVRVHDAFGDEASPSPDGSVVAFTRGGSSWMRRHYRGSDQREVWTFVPATGDFRRVTDWAGNDGQARWIGDDAL